ncbi:oxidoreductase [Escherichia coli]|nr:oxidoreductase [Escherichia coli]AHM42143.1 oxidoreductase [Escherichia coli]AHM46778.1 oxidoreductase [Escherichia coli]AHM51330.1 oxidoreductase [Escherichia coli]MCK3420980.1 oxidoreductase [Escherichia coli]
MQDLSSAKVRKSAEALRIIFHGPLIYSGKYTKARAEQALANG